MTTLILPAPGSTTDTPTTTMSGELMAGEKMACGMAAGVTSRVAIVGAGARGICAAEALRSASSSTMHVDLIDQSPAPAGLVAYGSGSELHLIGNVQVGRDIQPEELATYYDAVITTIGGSDAWDDLDEALELAFATDPHREPAPGIAELLAERGVPFTTWRGAAAGEQPPRTTDAWHDVIDQARAVPVCDQ